MSQQTSEVIEFEIVPADSGLELAAKNSLEIAFSGFFTEAAKWKAHAATITDPKLARTGRLELKNIRVAAEKKRKELKEDSLRMGKAIDGANNILLALIVPIEKGLEDIEKQEERRIAAELARVTAERLELIAPYLDPSLPAPSVGELTEDQFTSMLSDAKMLSEAKAAAAAKAEEDRIAREKAEAEERARVIAENARLKEEVDKREAELKAERAAAEKARLEAEAKAKAEREAIEEESRKEKLRIQALAEVERQKAQAAADAAAKQQAAERAAREKAEADAKALRDAEEKRIADAAAAKAKAAKAPDKEKLNAFANAIRDVEFPTLLAVDGSDILAKRESFAKWIEAQSEKL